MAGKKGKKSKKVKPFVKPDPSNAAPISSFNDMTAADVDPDVKQIRMAITALRRSLFTGIGVDPSKYSHIIRIQPKGSSSATATSSSCGCGCS